MIALEPSSPTPNPVGPKFSPLHRHLFFLGGGSRWVRCQMREGGVFKAYGKWSKMDNSAITRCICLRGSRVRWSQVSQFPHQAAIPKILNQTGHSENLTSSKSEGSTASWTSFVTQFHICEWKCLIPSVAFTIPQIASWGTRSRSGGILQSGLFKSCLDPFFEQIPN